MGTSGAESLARAAVDAGIEVVFSNPGTTENHLVHAFSQTRLRSYLTLFEGVAAGAADGYFRVSGRPAATLLHLGPGLANATANLHNARRAGSGVVNVVGQHASWHVSADPPLASDVESIARGASTWVRTCAGAGEAGKDMLEAAWAARSGAVATLIVPADAQWDEVERGIQVIPLRDPVREATVTAEEAAGALRRRGAALMIGGRLNAGALRQAARVAAATGCRLLVERSPAVQEAGGGLVDPERVVYLAGPATEQLAGITALVLAGARDPVAFFAEPGLGSRLLPVDAEVLPLAPPRTNPGAALAALANVLGAPPEAPPGPPPVQPPPPSGPITAGVLGAALAGSVEEGTMVVDETITSGAAFRAFAPSRPRHTWLSLTGGSIGYSIPCATGAAVAEPGRRVLTAVGDGSAAYTIQGLWTQARHALDVTTVICANRAYRILDAGYRHAGLGAPAGAAAEQFDLTGPAVDWIALARGFGVEGTRVATGEELSAALARAAATPGPHLIEAVMQPRG